MADSSNRPWAGVMNQIALNLLATNPV
jgi:hypothetical protein